MCKDMTRYTDVLGTKIEVATRANRDRVCPVDVEYMGNTVEVQVWNSARDCLREIALRYAMTVEEGLELLCNDFAYDDSLYVLHDDGTMWDNTRDPAGLKRSRVVAVAYDDGYTQILSHAHLVPEVDEETGDVCFYSEFDDEVA